MADYRTPGVYIEEKNAFPGSAVAVQTAVPVFIGYTEKSVKNGKSLKGIPTKITSFAEYVEVFGYGFQHKFTIVDSKNDDPTAFIVNGKPKSVKPVQQFWLYNALRLFYSNGGSDCYIVSVNNYYVADGNGNKTQEVAKITAEELNNEGVWNALKKEQEPTMVVIPDAISCYKAEDPAAFYGIYKSILTHCADTQSCFGIFDTPFNKTNDPNAIKGFREGIGQNNLSYGAAYYPWLKTAIVPETEVSFLNLDNLDELQKLLVDGALEATTTNINNIYATYKQASAAKAENAETAGPAPKEGKPAKGPASEGAPAAQAAAAAESEAEKRARNTNFHQALLVSSPTYVSILNEIRSTLNELPPAAAMAGIYTLVDSSKGVWKAPANVSLNMVNTPSINISNKEQEELNVNAETGKSINVIRPFPGSGTLVWGARTLAGNSLDWRYVNVRRTAIMIEQSLKLSLRAYVFEPNTASTWITVQSMISNFLTNLWKQGALAGAAPEQAFLVQIGLGTTMTPNDILEGKMLVTVKVAIARPAEFIILTFEQMQQQS